MASRKTLKRRGQRKKKQMYDLKAKHKEEYEALRLLDHMVELQRLQQEGKVPMNTTTQGMIIQAEIPETEKQRRYLFDELSRALFKIDARLEKEFHIIDDEPPRTQEELIQRIKDGMWEPEGNKEADGATFSEAWIRWRNPKHKPDKAGYRKARLASKDKFKDIERIIAIKSPDEGLAALIDYEAMSFH
jgi:hypothetical protein